MAYVSLGASSLSTSMCDFSFILFCKLIRLLAAPLPPTASLHDLRVVRRSCGGEGGTRQKRVNEKSYLEVERRYLSAGWRRDGAEGKTCGADLAF